MTTYDPTDRGALFRNKDMKTDKHPMYKGMLNVAGVEYDLAAWLKTSKAGDKYMSLAVQPKEAQAKQPDGKAIASMPADFSDEIPFS